MSDQPNIEPFRTPIFGTKMCSRGPIRFAHFVHLYTYESRKRITLETLTAGFAHECKHARYDIEMIRQHGTSTCG